MRSALEISLPTLDLLANEFPAGYKRKQQLLAGCRLGVTHLTRS